MSDDVGARGSDRTVRVGNLGPSPRSRASETPGRASPFRDCDIRGIYGEDVTDDLGRRIGMAVGTLLDGAPVVVGGDLRTSTPALKAQLVAGLLGTGCAVVDVGELPTPAFYFALDHLGVPAGVMVTASHSPPNHNGFKVVLDSRPITMGQLTWLEGLAGDGPFRTGHGTRNAALVTSAYEAWLDQLIRPLTENIRSIRTVVDAGHGSYWQLGPMAFRRAGFEVVELFCTPDGTFPSRSPNPADTGSLRQLGAAVVAEQAQLGVAFDGDGDRVAFVDELGDVVSADQFLAVMVSDVFRAEGPGRVVLDLKCSRAVSDVVEQAGGEVILEKSGHTFIKRRMLTERAVFGGELSGHLFYRALGGRDDGLYAGVRMAALIARGERSMSQLAAAVPAYVTTPDLRIPFQGDRVDILDQIAQDVASQGDAAVSRLDGVRVDVADGWALARLSVTEAALTFRFEVRQSERLAPLIRRFLGSVPHVRGEVEARLAALGAGHP